MGFQGNWDQAMRKMERDNDKGAIPCIRYDEFSLLVVCCAYFLFGLMENCCNALLHCRFVNPD